MMRLIYLFLMLSFLHGCEKDDETSGSGNGSSEYDHYTYVDKDKVGAFNTCLDEPKSIDSCITSSGTQYYVHLYFIGRDTLGYHVLDTQENCQIQATITLPEVGQNFPLNNRYYSSGATDNCKKTQLTVKIMELDMSIDGNLVQTVATVDSLGSTYYPGNAIPQQVIDYLSLTSVNESNQTFEEGGQSYKYVYGESQLFIKNPDTSQNVIYAFPLGQDSLTANHDFYISFQVGPDGLSVSKTLTKKLASPPP